MNKTDAYNEFDPTQSQGACGCSGVGFDIETLTWKQKKSPTPTDPCADVKGQLAQVQTELTQSQEALTQAQTSLAETQTKLSECEAAKCPDVTVLSLGNEVVFTGTSCDTITGLGGGAIVPNQ